MSRNKLYRNRVEVCLNDEQWDIVKELQKDKDYEKDTQWVIFSCPSTNNGDDYPTGLYQCQYPVILYSYWSEELGQFYDLYDFKIEIDTT